MRKQWAITSKGRIVQSTDKLGKDEFLKYVASEGDKEWKKLSVKKPEAIQSKHLTPDSRLIE